MIVNIPDMIKDYMDKGYTKDDARKILAKDYPCLVSWCEFRGCFCCNHSECTKKDGKIDN